ncbi:hypothetical protein FHR81_002440 [Actinoalloteichus hoggarensis]|uniref:Alpha-lytic protease n=1 Tax=Actinoalloteichus hoggarensis TaxID=1470176 RepID=A0A221VWW8_9PSEU|nr:S1 family peptidase [Actinoalloteichus hoggarensis]ASO18046.1 Alpha-lytic protease precursor [Actinoalloteichus hoggarensis]MBB5921400.1 hypothetical protein [Actinoalloteichus hoggarensis]
MNRARTRPRRRHARLLAALCLGLLASTGPGVAAAGQSAPAEQPALTLRGGQAIEIAGRHCAVGFTVAGGFLTAGHCGSVGAPVSAGGQSIGTVAGSVFPGSDMAWVRTTASVGLAPEVDRHDGTAEVVTGVGLPTSGGEVCLTGPVGGWRCGSLLGLNQTVATPGGTVTGLIRTDIPAFPGESGAPLIAAGRAVGTLVTATATHSHFQPVTPALHRWGLRINTG